MHACWVVKLIKPTETSQVAVLFEHSGIEKPIKSI